MSSKLDLQQLISSLNKAVSTSLDFLEKQHVDNLLKYFDKYGNPITSDFKVGDEVMRVPLFCLSNHQSLSLKEIELDFSVSLADTEDLECNENKGIKIDLHHVEKRRKMNVKIKMENEGTPEAVNRLNDELIQKIQHLKK
jgi:hypothetical protein